MRKIIMKNGKGEDSIQKSIVLWFSFQYPKLNGLLFHVNNNSSNVVSGSRMKALGVVRGVSDLVFLYNGTCYFIELKTKKGNQSIFQKIWQQKVSDHGFNYIVIRSVGEFKSFINDIVKK